MSAIIEVSGLTKLYGDKPAVHDVSFSVAPGEIVGFVGLNGAGKSTTINMLLGFQKPSAGYISLFGKRLSLPNAYQSHHSIGFATGDMTLFDTMTGTQYLSFVAKTYEQPLHTDAYKKLVQRFSPQLDKRLKTLSRGNKQKIALIAAFMTSPKLVILDEPSSGLDPLMQQAFLELVREEAAKGTTIFMSSHYLNEVADVCSRILLIQNGQLTKDIPAAELEAAAGKLVKVITKEKVQPPRAAESIEVHKHTDTYEVQFVFKDDVKRLQEWIGTLSHLQDLSINDHSAEAAFADLYTTKEPRDV